MDNRSFFCNRKRKWGFVLVFCLWSPTNVSTTWPGYRQRIWVLKIDAWHIHFRIRVFFFMILKVVFVLKTSSANYNSSHQLQKKRRKLVIVFCLLTSSSYTKAGGWGIIQNWLLQGKCLQVEMYQDKISAFVNCLWLCHKQCTCLLHK